MKLLSERESVLSGFVERAIDRLAGAGVEGSEVALRWARVAKSRADPEAQAFSKVRQAVPSRRQSPGAGGLHGGGNACERTRGRWFLQLGVPARGCLPVMRRLCAATDNWRIRSCGGTPGRQASEPTEAPSRTGSAAWWEDFEPLGVAGGATRAMCGRAGGYPRPRREKDHTMTGGPRT